MKAKTLTVLTLLGVLSQLSEGTRTYFNTDTSVVVCNTDTDCSYRCCNYTEEFYSEGECVEIEEEPRCETRKRNHRISLMVILVFTVVAWSTLIMLKIKEKKSNQERLAHLKQVKAREEANMPRRTTNMLSPTNAGGNQPGHRKN